MFKKRNPSFGKEPPLRKDANPPKMEWPSDIKGVVIPEAKIILSEEVKETIKQQVKEAVERGIDDYIAEFKEKERLLKENEYLATELEEKTEQLAHLQNEFNMWKKHMVEINEQN